MYALAGNNVLLDSRGFYHYRLQQPEAVNPLARHTGEGRYPVDQQFPTLRLDRLTFGQVG
jgi:hypothetical protein